MAVWVTRKWPAISAIEWPCWSASKRRMSPSHIGCRSVGGLVAVLMNSLPMKLRTAILVRLLAAARPANTKPVVELGNRDLNPN